MIFLLEAWVLSNEMLNIGYLLGRTSGWRGRFVIQDLGW